MAALAALNSDLERLRRRCRQQEETVQRLSTAVSVLKSGASALREENRELRLALERYRTVERNVA